MANRPPARPAIAAENMNTPSLVSVRLMPSIEAASGLSRSATSRRPNERRRTITTIIPTTANRIVAKIRKPESCPNDRPRKWNGFSTCRPNTDRLGTGRLPSPNTAGWSKNRNSAMRANAIVASAR